MSWWMWIPVALVVVGIAEIASEGNDEYGRKLPKNLERGIIVAALAIGLLYGVNYAASHKAFDDGYRCGARHALPAICE